MSTDRWVGIITPFRDEATGARWLSEISRTFAVADDDEGRDGNAVDDPVLVTGLFAFGVLILCAILVLIYTRDDDD